MGFDQVRVGVLVPLVVGLAMAFLPGSSGQAPQQGPPGLIPQWLQSASQAVGLSADQSQQVLQQQVKQLNWAFPASPKIPTPPPMVHVNRFADSVPTQGVTVSCNETSVYIQVSKDALGTDPTFNYSSLLLGGCAPVSLDPASPVLVYQSPLYSCGSRLTMTADELVYSFTLGTSPAPILGTPILRKAATRIFIQCHYSRLNNVSSSGLIPAWIPYASAQFAQERLVFSLRLMTDDWLSDRTSNQYYLGEVINIEASVLQFNHVPLRVLVDGCVATTVPEINSIPRYLFLDNFGCLIDAKLTQSSSQFMPQTQANKLRFQLEAFGFQQANSSLIHITCILRATAASAPADAEHKACSYLNNGWTAAYGADEVCGCCDSSCRARKGRDLSSKRGWRQKRRVNLRPIVVLENV